MKIISIKNFMTEQNGEGYADVAITILIVFSLMISIIMLFPIFTAHQSLNEMAVQMARTAEATGGAGTEVQDIQNRISQATGIIPESVEWETVWYNASENTIQLRTPFTLTLSYTVPVIVMHPALGEPVAINIHIQARATGISEVYYK